MKKKEAPSFDALKNPDLHYHYSRADRLSKSRHVPEVKKPQKFLVRIFGGNKTTTRMFIFYVILMAVMWIAFSFPGEDKVKREFNFTNGNKLIVRLVQDKQKYGMSVFLENTAEKVWVIKRLILTNHEINFITNISLELYKNEFETLFIALPFSISNLNKLTAEIE